MYCRVVKLSIIPTNKKSRLALYLCDLDTPVEQPLRAEFVLAVPDMFQQGAMTAELCDKLQVGSGTDTLDPENVHVVQASDCHHVLQ